MRYHCWGMIVALGTGAIMAGGATAQDGQTIRLTREELASAPALRLVEPLELFRRTGTDSTSQILGMDLAGTGEVYLLDGSRKEVRVLDSAGATVRTIQVPPALGSGMAVARDTVLLTAVTRIRPGGGRSVVLHVIGRGGAAEPRTRSLPVEFTGADVDVSATRSGWIFSNPVMEQPREARDEPLADSVILAEVDPVSLEMHRRVALPMAAPRYAVTPSWSLYRVMALQPTYDVGWDGRVYANVEGGFVIDVYGPSGRPERTIVGEVDRILYTEEEFQAWLDDRVRQERARARERGAGAEYADILARHQPRIGHADVRPVLGQIVASAEGRLLVRRLDLETPLEPFSRAGADHIEVWDLLDMEEGVLGRLRTPPGADVAEFAWPHVYLRFGEDRDHARVRYRIDGANAG